MHLLDTGTLTHLHAGHPNVLAHLQQLDDPDVGTTIITHIELARGRSEFLLKAATGEELLRAQRLCDRTQALLADLAIVPFDVAAAGQFDRLRTSRTYRRVGRADLLIASIALPIALRWSRAISAISDRFPASAW